MYLTNKVTPQQSSSAELIIYFVYFNPHVSSVKNHFGPFNGIWTPNLAAVSFLLRQPRRCWRDGSLRTRGAAPGTRRPTRRPENATLGAGWRPPWRRWRWRPWSSLTAPRSGSFSSTPALRKPDRAVRVGPAARPPWSRWRTRPRTVPLSSRRPSRRSGPAARGRARAPRRSRRTWRL